MKAVVITQFGELENLQVLDVPEPAVPSGNEVLIRVKAAGLNRADLLQVKGLYPPPPGYSADIPGLEFAGEVSSTGNDVSDFRTGDKVFGITAGEAQAEYLKVDASLLSRIPNNLSFTEAAAVPEAFITAHDALITLAGLKRGETVLIHAVGSGVGLAGLQIAKAAGAKVIRTSRTADKLESCLQFGLDGGLWVTDGGFLKQLREAVGEKGVNVILDLVGGGYFEQNLQSLAVKGRLVLVGLTFGSKANFDLGTALRKRAQIIGTVLRPRSVEEKAQATRAFARDVLPLLAAGTTKPNLDRVFAVKDVVEAYQYLASNNSFGKIVLEF